MPAPALVTTDPSSLIDLARYPILDLDAAAMRDVLPGPARSSRDRCVRGARLPHRRRPRGDPRRTRRAGAARLSQHGRRHRLSRGPRLRARPRTTRGACSAAPRSASSRTTCSRRVAAAPPVRVGSADGLHRRGARARPPLSLRRSARRAEPRGDGRRRRAAVALRSDGLRRLAGDSGCRGGRRLRGRAAHPQRRATSATTAVGACSTASSDEVVRLPMTPGTLLIFEGRYSIHRVSPHRAAPPPRWSGCSPTTPSPAP